MQKVNEKRKIEKISPKLLFCDAVKYMEHLCGRIDAECSKIGSELAEKISPSLLYSVYGKECISKEGVRLDGEQIRIRWEEYAGKQIEFYEIEKVVVYFLTIGNDKEKYGKRDKKRQTREEHSGECEKRENRYSNDKKYPGWQKEYDGSNETKSLLENFYIAGWENAYLEAARAYSREYMKEITNCACICDTFAPGIAGIPLEQLRQFFKILPAEKIGISYWKNSMLMPEKTVAGLYFLMRNTDKSYKKDCRNCIGKTIGCSYCVNAQKGN